MKFIRVAVSFVLMFSGFVMFYNPKQASAFFGWAGTTGSPYIGSAATQPMDINVSSNDGQSNYCSFKLDSNGFAHLVWTDDTSGNREIFYSKWDGINWLNASGSIYNGSNANISINTGVSDVPRLALDSAGNPHVTWTDTSFDGSHNNIGYIRWNGSNWVTASGTIYTGTNANVSNLNTSQWHSEYSEIEIDSNDLPHLTWFYGDVVGPVNQIAYVRWNGSNWLNASGSVYDGSNANITSTGNYEEYPSLDLDSNNMPHISWIRGMIDGSICYLRWNGSNWVNASGAVYSGTNCILSTTNGNHPVIRLDSAQNPHIVWRGSFATDIFYTKWNGSTWITGSGAVYSGTNAMITTSGTPADYPAMVIDSGNNPHIVWEDRSYSPEMDISYVKLSGTNWLNVLDSTYNGSNANVSSSFNSSLKPYIVLDRFDTPYISWEDTSFGNTEIILVKYTANFEGTFTLTKGVEANGNKLFDDHGKTVNPGTQLSYRIDWTADNPSNDPLEQAYLYDQIPPGTKYVAGTATTNELSHSLDNGVTWIAGEPPSNSLPGTRLRWGPFATGWVGAAKSKYIGSNLPQPYDVNVTKSMMQSNEPVMVLDNQNRPHFAWTAFDFTNWQPDVFYCKWDGTQWVNAAGLPLTYANSKITDDFMFEQFPTLAVDDNGYANIAWTSQSTPYNRISFARWDGTQWVNADGTPFSYGGSAVTDATFNDNRASIDLDSQGRPCIAWYTDDFSSWKVRYAHWDGSGWKTADGSTLTATNGSIEPANPNYGYIPSLRMNSQDNPCVAWQEYNISTNDDDVLYAYWNGSVWTGVDGSAYSFTNWSINKQAGTAYSASLALDSLDRPCIAFEYYTNWWDCDICFVRWDGADWTDPSGAVFVPGTNGYVANYPNMSIMPDVEIDGNDNPCLTWIDSGSGNDQAYFARWNGSAWVTADGQPINLTNPNVSSMPSHIYDPMLAMDSFGNPHMAWLGMASGNPEGPLDILYVNYLPAQRTVYFDVKVDNPFVNLSLSPICNTATFNHRYNTGSAFESNEACVYIKTYEPKPILTITKTAGSFEYNAKDTFEFTIAVKNTGDAVASGVVLTDLFPKELEFISSMPSGSAGISTVKFALGNLNPGMSEVFKLKFRLSGKVAIDDCVMLTNEAMATSGTIVVKDSAIFKVCAPKAPCPLYFDTIWTGLAKNIGKVNQAVTATVTPKCGSSPYTVVIDWGDGTKSTGVLSKTNESFKAEHTYTSTGDFTIKVTVTDAYMATRITDKRIKIE